MNSILVTVLLPMYRENPLHALDSITSIIKQTYINLEVIIIFDDPLNFELMKKVKSNFQDERIIYIYNKDNLGLPLSLNKGIEKARGKYIIRMDGDDISAVDRIERQVDFMEKNIDISLSGTYASVIDTKGHIISEYKKPTDEKLACEYLKLGSSVIHPTWIVRAKIFKYIGSYDNIVPAQDYAFLIKLCLGGYKIANLPLVLLKYRVSSDSISHRNGIKSIKTANILRKTAQGKISFSHAIHMINNIDVKSNSIFNRIIVLRGSLLMKGKGAPMIHKIYFFTLAGLLSFFNKDILLDSINLIKINRFNLK